VIIEGIAGDEFNQHLAEFLGHLLVDEDLRLQHPQEPLLVQRTGQHEIGGGLAALHVAREQDRYLVKEQEQGLERVDLAAAPVRLGVAVRDLVARLSRICCSRLSRICCFGHARMPSRTAIRAKPEGIRASKWSHRTPFRREKVSPVRPDGNGC
jgi:hypothetical protein